MADVKAVILSKFKANLRKEDVGVLKAAVKAALAEKREFALREKVAAEAMIAAEAKAAAEEKAKAANAARGLLGRLFV